jgi:hypothetical protein
MDQLCCFRDLRKTLYSSFGSVGISESSGETEAARINFRMNLGRRDQNFALELPSVDRFLWPSTSWARSSRVACLFSELLEDGAHVGRREWRQG